MSDGVIAAIIGAAATIAAAYIATRTHNKRYSSEAGAPRGLTNPPVNKPDVQRDAIVQPRSRPSPLAPQRSHAALQYDAVIRSDGNYADGTDHQYVAIDKPLPADFPAKEGQRIS